MGTTYGNKIITDGLILNLDAANIKSYPVSNNLIDPSTWTVGTGSVTGFNCNGTSTENNRLLDTDPFGNSVIVWEARADVTSGADGGWNTPQFPINLTKTYRFSTWIRRTVLGNGTYYFGTNGYNSASSNIGVLYRSTGSNNTNAYFRATSGSEILTDWFLLVAHVWPEGSGTGSMHLDTGLYTTSGTKIVTPGDYVWNEGTEYTVHRTYLYYSTDTSTRQQWIYPRVDCCDGTEPTLSDLLSNNPNIINDLSGNKNHGNLINIPTYNSDNCGSLLFDGIDDYITFPTITMLKESATFMCWCYIDDFTTGKNNLGRFIVRSSTTASSKMIVVWDGGYGFETNTNSNPNELYGRTTPPISASSITTETIFHFALVFNSSVSYGYVNGELINSIAISDDLTIDKIGSELPANDNYPAYLKGKIFNMIIYNRPFSQTEITQNYNTYKGRFGH
jgi:hypothetical protein